MRHITEAQLHDVRSQAYMLIAQLNSTRTTGVYKQGVGYVTAEVPGLKKSTAMNLVAKALGYTSWSHLTLTAKGKEPCTDFVQLFNSHDEGRDFFRAQLPGFDPLFLRDLVNVLPFNRSRSESPYLFIDEVCSAYELKPLDLATLPDPEAQEARNPEWVLHDSGDPSVGIYAFTTEFSFDSLAAMDAFLQRHIDLIRGDLDIDNMDAVFETLTARWQAEQA